MRDTRHSYHRMRMRDIGMRMSDIGMRMSDIGMRMSDIRMRMRDMCPTSRKRESESVRERERQRARESESVKEREHRYVEYVIMGHIRMNESCRIRMSNITYVKYVIMSHVTYERVMSHSNVKWHVRQVRNVTHVKYESWDTCGGGYSGATREIAWCRMGQCSCVCM